MNAQSVMPAETPTPRVLAETVADRVMNDPSSFTPADLDTIQEGFCTGRYAGFLDMFVNRAPADYLDRVLSEHSRVMALRPCRGCQGEIKRRYA